MNRAGVLALGCFLCSLAPAVAGAQGETPALSADELLKLRWQRLLREADQKIDDARHKLESARQAADVAGRQAVLMATGPNQAARAAALEAVKTAEAEVAAAEKAKADLLEKARVEGVPPGYLR